MQGKSILTAALCGLAALVTATPALAIMSIPNGWYLEANIGSSRLSDKNYSNVDIGQSGIGGNGNVGYKFMPYVAAEIGYSRYPDSDVDDLFGNQLAKIEFYSYDIAIRGIVPMSDTGFEFFAKLGASRISASLDFDATPSYARSFGVDNGSHTTTGLYWGVGGQYYWWPELAINAQYQVAQGNSSTGSLSLLSAGLSFIFD